MDCREYSEAIAAWVDGQAPEPGHQRAVERHAEACAACRALAADLRSIQAAAFTLDRHQVPSHVLGTLQARTAVEGRPSPPRRLLSWPRSSREVWIGAAAAVVLATSIGVYSLMRPVPVDQDASTTLSGEEARDAVASVQAELQAAEEHYNRAIQGLEQIARSDGSTLDPDVAAVLQKNLQVIDQAIGESRVALQTQPASASAQDSLFDALRSKVALLQQTVELINEMRKGNQAEAGRLIQGLNQ
jgi:anti-sigma factor RsiW